MKKLATPRERAKIALSCLSFEDFNKVIVEVERAIEGAIIDCEKIAERNPRNGEFFDIATGKAIAIEIRARMRS